MKALNEMKPKELLQYYGLKFDLNSVKERIMSVENDKRIYWRTALSITYRELGLTNMANSDERLKASVLAMGLEHKLQSTDMDLLYELAEIGERTTNMSALTFDPMIKFAVRGNTIVLYDGDTGQAEEKVNSTKYYERGEAIEVIQWTGKNLLDVIVFMGQKAPDQSNRMESDKWDEYKDEIRKHGLVINTSNGRRRVYINNYIVKYSNGLMYPFTKEDLIREYVKAE